MTQQQAISAASADYPNCTFSTAEQALTNADNTWFAAWFVHGVNPNQEPVIIIVKESRSP